MLGFITSLGDELYILKEYRIRHGNLVYFAILLAGVLAACSHRPKMANA